MAYIVRMILIETPIFTREIQRLLPDETYRQFQKELVVHPEAGDLIVGSGGLRKIRWALPGKGKSGGVRVIYYWHRPHAIFLLLPFKKSEAEDLTADQVKLLRRLVEEWLK